MGKREYDKSTFGGLLHILRMERDIGFDEFRAMLGVSKAYLNDVETDSCRPPTSEVQIKIVGILSSRKPLSREQLNEFYAKAAESRGELPADVSRFLSLSPAALDRIRSSSDYRQYWQNYQDK